MTYCCQPLLSTIFIDSLDESSVQVRRGGAEGTRTPDPHTASVVRYQLRHSPMVRSSMVQGVGVGGRIRVAGT